MRTKKYFYAILVLLLCTAIAGSARAENTAYDIHLDRTDSAKQLSLNGRVSAPKDGKAAILRGGGSVFVEESTGAGTYSIKFELQEPDKFQYHRSYVGLFVKDPKDPKSDGYYLFWDPAGIISFHEMRGGKMTLLNQFIRGGKDNPNKFKAGDIIELTLRVPEKGDGVWIWCRAANAEGEPTTGFKFSDDLPKQGYFGAYNAKWYSYMVVHQLKYQPVK